MVQSSQGWDAAPHSGWGGGQTSAPSKGKGAKTPRAVPPGAASRDGLGAASPLPSPRAASSLRPRSGSLAPLAARTSPPLPALVGAGTAVGRPARSCGGGWAGARGAAGCLQRPGPGDDAGVAARHRSSGPVGREPVPRRALREGPPALSYEAAPPPAIDCWCPIPYLQFCVTETRETPLGGAWRWPVGVSLRKQWPGVGWAELRSTCAVRRVQRRES